MTNQRRTLPVAAILGFVVSGIAVSIFMIDMSLGQGFGGRGRNQQRAGRGYGQNDPDFRADQTLFHTLLSNREKIHRHVTERADGVETLTETDDPKLRDSLMQHVKSMHQRVTAGRPIHLRDPLFAELFRNADKIDMKIIPTAKGVRVVETSKDPHVAQLIKRHAEVVSLFLKNGHAEVRQNHSLKD